MSRAVESRLSRRSPPMDRITSPMQRLLRSASIVSSSAVLRARRSGLQTVRTSPSRKKLRHSARTLRLDTLLTCSENSFTAPAARRSRS